MTKPEEYTEELKGLIQKEIKIIKELVWIMGSGEFSTQEEKMLAQKHLNSLKGSLLKTSDSIYNMLSDMSVTKPLPKLDSEIGDIQGRKVEKKEAMKKKEADFTKERKIKYSKLGIEISELEKDIIKRLKKKEKKKKKVVKKKASKYVAAANKLFGNFARKVQDKRIFVSLKQDLTKASLDFVPTSYISMMFLTTAIAFVLGILLFIFLLFFKVGADVPFVTQVSIGFFSRLAQVFWVIIALPLATILAVYFYPAGEKSYLETKINQELPFVTIHMAAISGSMVEPSKMFNIIIATGDYPFTQKEFVKLINQINIYGYDFVTALRNVAFNSASQRLSELLNGLATTINSGGDLTTFFEKRAQSLLFEYRLDREKYAKTAETFMDIYISLVIAAPMILMLLLIMMSVSNLGLSVSPSAITLLMILGVSVINFFFLVFIKLKQPPS